MQNIFLYGVALRSLLILGHFLGFLLSNYLDENKLYYFYFIFKMLQARKLALWVSSIYGS